MSNRTLDFSLEVTRLIRSTRDLGENIEFLDLTTRHRAGFVLTVEGNTFFFF